MEKQIKQAGGRALVLPGDLTIVAATKWALIGFSRCLMLEVREHNIRVITVCPGSVDTNFSPSMHDPVRAEKILSPLDVADTVLAAILLPQRAMVSEIDIRPTNPK